MHVDGGMQCNDRLHAGRQSTNRLHFTQSNRLRCILTIAALQSSIDGGHLQRWVVLVGHCCCTELLKVLAAMSRILLRRRRHHHHQLRSPWSVVVLLSSDISTPSKK